MNLPAAVTASLLLSTLVCGAQQKQGGGTQDMPGKDMGSMEGMDKDSKKSMKMQAPENLVEEILRHDTSGTSAQPDSTPAPMLMRTLGQWNLMFHANVFIVDGQETGPRGADKFFSTSWFMGMAQRRVGPGTLTARSMLSLEPATITGRRYPLLFQQGETAFGKPITDAQHPHDFIMELGVLYDLKLDRNTLLSLYFAPVGDPAIGPTAFPHRASAYENPLAPLGHHQEDSTHISDDVITAGFTYRAARIEGSGFHGREPDEFRWDVDQGAIDSWSTRLTLQPGKNWSGQYSYAHIHSPEALFPLEDQERMTASIMYNHPLHHGNWAGTALWGRTHSPTDNSIFNSYLAESTLNFHQLNYVWTRIESAERSSQLMLAENPLPDDFQEKPIGEVQAYTFGYDRDFNMISGLSSALGAQFTAYGVPSTLRAFYGAHPFEIAMFLRLRPLSGESK